MVHGRDLILNMQRKIDDYFIMCAKIYGMKTDDNRTIEQIHKEIPEYVYKHLETLKKKPINRTLPTKKDLDDYWGSEDLNKGDPNSDGTETLTYILREYGPIGIPETRLTAY